MKKRIFISVGILVLAVILSISLYFIKTEQYRDWLPVEGFLTNIEERHGHSKRGGSDWVYELFYTYTVAGEDYHGSSVYSGKAPEGHFIGERVTVWYNPDAVSESSYHKPGPELWPTVPIIFGIVLALRVLLSKRRRRVGGETFDLEANRCDGNSAE